MKKPIEAKYHDWIKVFVGGMFAWIPLLLAGGVISFILSLFGINDSNFKGDTIFQQVFIWIYLLLFGLFPFLLFIVLWKKCESGPSSYWELYDEGMDAQPDRVLEISKKMLAFSLECKNKRKRLLRLYKVLQVIYFGYLNYPIRLGITESEVIKNPTELHKKMWKFLQEVLKNYDELQGEKSLPDKYYGSYPHEEELQRIITGHYERLRAKEEEENRRKLKLAWERELNSPTIINALEIFDLNKDQWEINDIAFRRKTMEHLINCGFAGKLKTLDLKAVADSHQTLIDFHSRHPEFN